MPCPAIYDVRHGRKRTSFLSPHVLHVVEPVSCKQMVRIHTFRIIAFVKHPKFSRVSMRNRPRNSVWESSEFFEHEPSVSMRAFTPGPNPAPAKLFPNYRTFLIYLRPESSLVFFRKFRDWSCSHIANCLSFVVSVFQRLQPLANALNLQSEKYLSTVF